MSKGAGDKNAYRLGGQQNATPPGTLAGSHVTPGRYRQMCIHSHSGLASLMRTQAPRHPHISHIQKHFYTHIYTHTHITQACVQSTYAHHRSFPPPRCHIYNHIQNSHLSWR